MKNTAKIIKFFKMAYEINKALRYKDKRQERKERQTHRGTETETYRKKGA